MIKKLISYYWRVTLLKDSPEITPYSYTLFVFSVVLLTLMLALQWHIVDTPSYFLFEFIVAITLVLSYVLYTGLILWFKSCTSRIIQTTTSLLMAHNIIHFLSIPLLLSLPYLTDAHLLKNPIFLFIAVVHLFITLGFSVWQFVVTAHIYKYALNTTPIQSVLAAFGLVAVNILTISLWR